jgi:mannose-6-phosphate isomerase-like protein (cupin superfamily)
MPHNSVAVARFARRTYSRTERRTARLSRVSHLDPVLVDVRTFADHPLVSNGPTSSLRMVAPGAVTAGRYGLLEYRMAPHSPGAAPHFHQTFSESFYVLSGELTIYAAGEWQVHGPGDYALVHEGGAHGFRNDGDEEAAFLILFAPGIARERFFSEMAELRRDGRILTPEQLTAFYARHDQVMI